MSSGACTGDRKWTSFEATLVPGLQDADRHGVQDLTVFVGLVKKSGMSDYGLADFTVPRNGQTVVETYTHR